MNTKCYLFDLDGTLTDPGIGITNSVMYALDKFGIHVSDRKELYRFIGPPLDESFMKFYGFTEAQASKAVGYYRENYRNGGLYENEVYPGIPKMLDELKKENTVIALATSKPYEFSVKILEHFKLDQYFDYVGAATMDGKISKKADVLSSLMSQMGSPDPDSILMIGDRHHDIEGAKANNLKSVGVLWGYGSKDELVQAGADYIIEKPADILSFCR